MTEQRGTKNSVRLPIDAVSPPFQVVVSSIVRLAPELARTPRKPYVQIFCAISQREIHQNDRCGAIQNRIEWNVPCIYSAMRLLLSDSLPSSARPGPYRGALSQAHQEMLPSHLETCRWNYGTSDLFAYTGRRNSAPGCCVISKRACVEYKMRTSRCSHLQEIQRGSMLSCLEDTELC